MASQQKTDTNITEPTSGPSHQSGDTNAVVFPDGGWGWVVVFAALVLLIVADGIRFGASGLLYVELLAEFGESKAYTGAVGSVFIAMPLLSGPLMSAFVDIYGCRKITILGGLTAGLGFVLSAFVPKIEYLFLTMGVVAGLGVGMTFMTGVVGVANWFDKRLALTIGIASAGSGIGTFLFAPMATYFIELYGWRGAVLLLGGCLLNCCVCGMVFLDPPWLLKQKKLAKARAENSATVEAKQKWYVPIWKLMKQMCNLSIFLEFHYFLFQMSKITFYIWYIFPYFYVAEHMLRNGYTEEQASLLLSVIGICNTVGLVVLGWIGDRHWFDLRKCYAFLLFVCGSAVLVIPFVTHIHYLLMTCTSIFGFCFAGMYAFTPSIMVDMVTLERFPNAYGLTLMCEGIGNLVGPALGGWIFDITGTWDMSFYASGFFIIISGVFIIIITLTKNRTIFGKPLNR